MCGSSGCGGSTYSSCGSYSSSNYERFRQYNSCGGYTKEVIVCGGSVEYRPISSGCGSGGCGGGAKKIW